MLTPSLIPIMTMTPVMKMIKKKMTLCLIIDVVYALNKFVRKLNLKNADIYFARHVSSVGPDSQTCVRYVKLR